MKIRIHSSFDSLPEAARQLLQTKSQENFMHGLSWFENLAKTGLDQDVEVKICATDPDAASDQNTGVMVGRVPAGQGGSVFKTHKPTRNSFASLTSHQSTSYAISISDSGDANQMSRFAGACGDALKQYALLDLNFFLDNDAQFESIAQGLRASGFIIRPYEYANNVYEQVDGRTFEKFLADRPSVVRRNYARMSRRLHKDSEVECRIYREPEEYDKALNYYQQVLDKSWKEAEPYPEYSAGLILTALHAGVLRLGVMRVDGVAVAAQIWIVSNGRATILKTHYHLDYGKQSVGAVLMLKMFEQVIDHENVSIIDYGVGDEKHKICWLKDLRPFRGMLAFNIRTPAGIAELSRYEASSLLTSLKQKAAPTVKRITARLKISSDTKKKS